MLQSASVSRIVALALLGMSTAGCELAERIFKAGVGVGALVVIGVIVLLVFVHERERASRVTLMTIALGTLAGGAIGNLVDRLHYGYVLDFIDIGIGNLRFWTFNLADAGITTGILLLLADAILPARILPSIRTGGAR